ncbi:MAG: HAMP domain-containing histidine kinase [Deltaproteobacteria bacterium]|nr:HAMP domain-containing histidine kinase [Deltaproteobacteria bacterium]
MNPGKLYIKILISFLFILFTTLIVVFILFIALPSKHFTTRLEQYANTRALMIREIVEGKIQSAPTKDLSENEPLKDFVSEFGEILGGKIWLQKPDGTIPLKSFTGEIPMVIVRLKKRPAIAYGNITIYHRRDLDFYAIIPLALPGGETGQIHVLFDRQEGPPHPVKGFALGLFIIGFMAALLFIPVSKLITNRLKQLRQSASYIAEGNLSHRAAVRGKDEIGDLARAFNRMAEKSENMLISSKELTANLSHELRTPLTRIRVTEEILREKLEKENIEDWKRHLDGIREDISELDTLIGRILELSKLDIQETPFTFSSFDLSEAIYALLRKLQPIIEQKALKISTDLSFQPPFMGDKEAIGTALLNILDNAVKYTQENGEITIQMESGPDMLYLRITNTHEPIPEQELTKIFDPFHRAKKAKASGSGLGLAIAKKIVEKHGGAIEARNTGKGLEFRVILPVNV